MTAVSASFSEHRTLFSARSPDKTKVTYPDELQQIGSHEGLLELHFPAPEGIVTGICPTSREDAFGATSKSVKSKYLWVVAIGGVPTALEHPSQGTTLRRGRLTHTNLTGGAEAHTGGELWFHQEDRIVINGGSGRYPPRNAEELRSVALALKAAGYMVASMGWDEEGGVVRFLREDPGMARVEAAELDLIFGKDSCGRTPEDRARTSTRIFVRSQDHLSLDNPELSGRRLTAWEALQSFGLDVLWEVFEYSSAILPASPMEPALTLKTRRNSLGLSLEGRSEDYESRR